MIRKKGNKEYTKREKQMMISLINDYSLFGDSGNEMIDMLSLKIGKENNEENIKSFSIAQIKKQKQKEDKRDK